jgi:hypothetical protein
MRNQDPIRIHVDFNSRTPDGNIVLNPRTALPEIMREAGNVTEGLGLVIHDTEIEVDAVLGFNTEFRLWVAIPDWITHRDIPDFESKGP